MIYELERQAIALRAERHAARSSQSARSLFEAPPARPTEQQSRLFRQCLARAREHIDVPGFVLSWRRAGGDDGVSFGAAKVDEFGVIHLALSVNHESEWQFAGTCYHELKHVSDFASGRALTREAMEFRAMRFSFEMLNDDEGIL